MKEDEGMGRVVRWDDDVRVRGNDKSLGLPSDDARGIEAGIYQCNAGSFMLGFSSKKTREKRN